MSTLKDVAEIAGVSVSTVSYVMSGKKTVRPETLKRIQDAIKQVDYCPNLLASGLKTNLSKTIGVVMWDMQNNYSIEVLRVMEDMICKYGYCMIVCDSDQSPEKERKNLRRLLARNIDGLILMGSGNNVLSSYRNAQVPIVCIDRVADEAFLTVQSDSIAGGQMGTEYLLSKGRRKILFLGYDLDVDELVYSEILVNWPLRVLCKEDCKGICSICGKNLNHGTCDCDHTDLDPRMAQIRDIFNKFKEV